jgi:type IV secretory pathway VirB4 component
MGSVTQTVTDNFGWFEMHNEGVDIFNYNPQTTYGCMIDIKKFPEAIETVNFPMEFAGIDYINLVTTIQCLKKEDAQLKIKRVRASDNYELQQAIESGAELEQLEGISKNVAIATHALTEIEKGEIICNFNASLLVTAETKDDLKARIAEVITSCKDRDILASKSLTQALDFLNNYINKKPQKFIHLTSIEFPLSFQQNYGSTVGDTDEVWSPAIGEDV